MDNGSREMNVSSEGFLASINSTEEDRGNKEIAVNNTVLYTGIIVCSLGLLLNIVTVTAISRVKRNNKIRWQHTYFLLNIMICDIIITAAGLTFFCLKLYEYQLFGHELTPLETWSDVIRRLYLQCGERMVHRVADLGATANLLGLLLMSFDHFILVRCSLRHRILMRKGVVFSLLTVSWIASAVLSMTQPMMVQRHQQQLVDAMSEYYEDMSDKTGYCFLETFYLVKYPPDSDVYLIPLDQHLDVNLRTWIGITLLTLTFVVMVGVHSYIAAVVVRVNTQQQRRLRGCGVVAKQQEISLRKRKTKGLCTTLLLLSTFTVVWLPLKVVYILDLTGNKTLDAVDYQLLFRWLLVTLSTTALFDVAVYFLRSKELIAFLELRGKCMRGSRESSRSNDKSHTTRQTQLTRA